MVFKVVDCLWGFPRVKAEGQSFYHCVSTVVDRRLTTRDILIQHDELRQEIIRSLEIAPPKKHQTGTHGLWVSLFFSIEHPSKSMR